MSRIPGRLDGIATALADQTTYEHRWLFNPGTGEVVFWTAEAGSTVGRAWPSSPTRSAMSAPGGPSLRPVGSRLPWSAPVPRGWPNRNLQGHQLVGDQVDDTIRLLENAAHEQRPTHLDDFLTPEKQPR